VSIAVRYPLLQRRQTSPNSRQSQGKNLLTRILPHRPMVTSDQPLRLRPAFHLLFLHFISRPINCISPSSDSAVCFFFGLGVTGGGVFPLERIWSIVTSGLVCNAVRRMTFRKSLDQCSARPATGRCRQDFGRTIRILDYEGNQVTRLSGISSIGPPIISYSKGVPLADFASTTPSPPSPLLLLIQRLITSPIHRSGNNYHSIPYLFPCH